MNVFDFDNTIYDGESSFDFFKFCIRKKPSLIKHMPRVLVMIIKYKRGIVPEQQVMEFCIDMLSTLTRHKYALDIMLEEFWLKNRHKLKSNIMNIIHQNDVIISASPSFIFDNVRDMFKNVRIISTEVDIEKNKIEELCYGANKVEIFKRNYPGIQPDNFYTDNMNDMPMIQFSRRSWLVKGNKITEI